MILRRSVIGWCLLFLFVILPLNAQWARTLGGWSEDKAYSIHPTADGGCVISGTSSSFGNKSYLIFKLSSTGKIEWQKVFGSVFDPLQGGAPIFPTKDGGYIFAPEAYVLKLASTGEIEWQRRYPGQFYGTIVRQTPDDGYVIAGYTDYFISTSVLWAVVKVVKLTARGDVEWSAKYGLDEHYTSIPTTLALTADGGCLLCGYNIGKGWIPQNLSDTWIMKLDSHGAVARLQYLSIGGYRDAAVDTTADGGAIFTAGAHMIKFDAGVSIVWQKRISAGSFKSVQKTKDGKYIAAGSIDPAGSGKTDMFVLKTNAAGTVEWQKRYGGTGNDDAASIKGTAAGGYLVAGSTDPFGAGAADAIVLSIDANGEIDPACLLVNDVSVTVTNTVLVPETYTNLPGTPWGLIPEDTNVSLADSDLRQNALCGSSLANFSVTPNRLDFGARAGLADAQVQHFSILNNGNTPFTWSVGNIPAWLTCSPSSGTGSGRVAVAFDPAGLPVGGISAVLTIASASAENSPQLVSVNAQIVPAGSNVVPFGCVDTPFDGSTGITGAIPVTGWALDDLEVTKVEIWRDACDGEAPGLWYIGDGLFVEGARPDVEQAYPGFPWKNRAGWGYMLLTNMLPNQGNGAYRLHAFAADREGNRVLLGTKSISCSNATALRPFGTIDTPAQGGTASGNNYVNFGWVLAPLPLTIPQDGSTIHVYLDGVKVVNLADPPNFYNRYREDIAKNFPGLNNTGAPGGGGPVGAFFLDTTKFMSGMHMIAWVAIDDWGHGAGIGSRYFNILNAGGSAGAGSPVSVNPGNRPLPAGGITKLPPALAPVRINKGFAPKAAAEWFEPDGEGTIFLNIEELERIELDPRSAPAGAVYSGGQIVGGEVRPLPVGSTLDARSGRFSWMPGPGFLGDYLLIFVEDARGERRASRVRVNIGPKRQPGR